MNNLSLKTTFVILVLSIIATSMEASPPECTQTDNRKLLSLAKKTQEPQKASPPLALLPRGLLRGVKFGRGHWLLVLAAIILAGTSSIFGNKKAE